MHSPYWIDCQVAPPCMVWTLRTMSLTSDPGSYQINCCPYVPITWLLTNRRCVTSVALSPLNWTDVFVLCACLLRWELVNGLLNMVLEPGRHGELWEVGKDGETLAALPVVGFCPVLAALTCGLVGGRATGVVDFVATCFHRAVWAGSVLLCWVVARTTTGLLMHTGAPGGFLSLGRLCGGVHISGAGVGLGSCCSSWGRQVGVARRRARGFDSCVSRRCWVSWTLWVVLGLCVTTWVYSCLSVSTDYINMSSELQKRRTSCKGWVTRVSNSMKDYLNKETVPDKVKLSEMLTDLDKRLVSLDMVQGEFELTFEDDT